ncbi:Prolipoprotein diacylglyceryl transferase [wastewater metagenome]|uniref:Prolipoprotein diacylglyceryl transferase n=2 Tax=unclassified sequences TaxID=12908 RepID=A0A5B8RDK8_9ZZZZ|nr:MULTISPECIES: prolipoprotein diacylglyceryl transferase [Arhodomonas]QEA06193.1 prolipoprotein diacylglyceryl transferase [uncultured organism]
MLTYPQIDPIAIQLGPVAVHWYGLMYAVSFLAGWWLARRRARAPWRPLEPVQMDDLIVYVAIGVVVGGRLGYMLFYGLDRLAADPLSLFRIWEGGMSFHGGLIGVLVTVWLFARRIRRGFFEVIEFVAPIVPIGLGAGRLGNFINGELWGAPTDLPWGMVYPPLGPVARHPSQLYEFALEGVVLFVVLWWFSRRPRPTGAVAGLFLACYGTFRFIVEFVRLPDPQLGYLAWGWLTMGQVLSAPMIIGGAALLAWAYGSSTNRPAATS